MALHRAYVLHARRQGDTSQLLDLLSRDDGRVACIARGTLSARRPDARLQPFQLLQVELRGRGEVLSLVRAEPLALPLALTGTRLFCALYLNELLQRLTAREDPLPLLFDDYGHSLSALAGAEPVEPVLRAFELALLQHLGLGVQFAVDRFGVPVRADSRYLYQVESGAEPATADSVDSVRGATLEALRSGRYDDAEVLREARRLMRRIIDHYLGGRPLKSRELFR